jgi:hypothetical protein
VAAALRLLHRRSWCRLLFALLWAQTAVGASAQPAAEYQVKAAFLYNFAAFIEWPAGVGKTLNFCVYGTDPFGDEFDKLDGRSVAARVIKVQRPQAAAELKSCQMLFVAAPTAGSLPRIAEGLRGVPVAIVADSPAADRRGAVLNMAVVQDRVVFDADLVAARSAGLVLSSKLLRLAREVHQ